ncbi:replication-relaxation family protein [Actinomadura xylanilytica]|uniref:replication-relaxation family protein n=1 Tax=Actinomadura xylanilytica TaxID=887459 RepID=UPI00255A7E1F|nr:replication-relaxation family protein [Actinomadura xylanilytica]MDL4775746.1 replication-relaxation family protein [Actinomadura xylanilytica]
MELALLELAGRLTDRDREVIRAVADHRVLTTGQICDLAFTSEVSTRHRLAVLAGLGVLARFRPRLDRGSAPWHYVLDVLGAAVLAAEDDTDLDRVRVRRDKSLAIASSPRLAHLVGCNGFFTALTLSARTTQSAVTAGTRGALWQGHLERWWSAQQVARKIGDLVRPDGYGRWREERLEDESQIEQAQEVWGSHAGGAVDFFVEYDTGTENLNQLASKLTGYQKAAEWFALDQDDRLPWLVFVFTRHGREPGARRALNETASVSARYGQIQLPIATGVFPGDEAGDRERNGDPAGPLWLPLETFAHLSAGESSGWAYNKRLRLAQLPAVHPPAPVVNEPRVGMEDAW